MVSIKREQQSIEKGFREFLTEEGGGTEGIGQYLLWWQFDEANSRIDPLYDESPGRSWDEPLHVPVLWSVREEGVQSYSEESGSYSVQRSPLVVLLLADAVRFGIRFPEDPEYHWKDRFAFEHILYSIDTYKIWGHFPGTRLTVSIGGSQVKADESAQDMPRRFTGIPF